MKISFNPSNSNKNILDLIKNNKDIIFDLKGHSIFARGVEFKGTDTNTWRDIKINNVSIGSHTLDLRNGSNTTLTNTNGVVTINSTWRPVVDNLTSDSTTSSLSAKQGKVLKALIDGKSNSDHNHDGRYVRYYAVTTLDCNNLAAGLTAARISATNAAHTNHSAYLYISDVETPFQIQIPDSSIPYIYKRYYGSGKWSGWFKLNAGYADSAGSVAWANVTGKPSSYTPSAHTHDDRYYTKAESNAKYITDITTSVNKLTFTKNGSNIIRDITVNVVHSQGHLTNIPNKDATTKASPGLLIYDSYGQTIGTNLYSSVLSINTGGTIQIAGNWGDDHARNLYWRSQSDGNVADYPWKSWRTILDSENYSSTLDSRYYTESEVNSLLSRKLDRVNLTTGSWNPRGYHLAADYNYNGGDLSISENNGKMYISVDGCFWQNEGQYRVLDTSDIGDIRDSVTLHQYLSATDAAWYPLVWGGASHNNTSDSTGPIYKSYDKLCWQTSSQTLYATNIQTNNIKNLSIGGGIYWNPYVESASDNTDAASITLVRSGVAGGTTLVLSQMNDTNDTIQFKTNTAARLYHNSYPILTTQNTYVSNNKGYINGLEITQVNNADTLDGYHANGLLTALSNSDKGISITVGGTTKSISNISVNYASSAGNADTVDGFQVNVTNAPYGHIPSIGNDGVMEVGKYIDFHNDNNGKHDYSTRLLTTGNYRNSVNLPSAAGTLALINDVNNYYWANVKISASSSTTTSPTVHTLTATRVCAGHNPGIDNSISCSNWFRSSGNTGWYNTTYQGGWYMSDTSWIRAHNSVGIYTDGQMRASGFHHASVNSDNYMLLAGGGYKSFGGDDSTPIFLGCLDLYRGNDGTISSSFCCLGYSVPFTYTRGGNYCKIVIPDTTRLSFYIIAATASVNYSGGGMDTWTGYHRGSGAWWLHCYALGWNEVRVKGFCQANNNNDSWWGGNPLWNNEYGANKITVCIFGHVKYK